MKRAVSTILCLLLVLSLVGCAKTYHSTSELAEKARKEFHLSKADGTEIQYVGMSGAGDHAVAWFITGGEYQAYEYLPMEITLDGDSSDYSFVRTLKPMTDRGEDIAIAQWNDGYAFLINNPKVAEIRIYGDIGTYTQAIGQENIPFLFFYPAIPTEYHFLDADGNEL